jgi:hypothetical protein
MNPGTRWTPEDDWNLLALRSSGLSWQKAAQALGRTEAATMARAARLKANAGATEDLIGRFPRSLRRPNG